MGYIYDTVKKLRDEYCSSDPFELCDCLGVRCYLTDLGGLQGMFSFICEKPVVFVSDKLDRSMRRLSCAHELGHYVLHSEIAKENCLREFEIFDMRDKTEYEANVFAAHLLIDEEEMFELLRESRSVFETAMIMDINPNLLNIKLSELNSMGYNFDTSWGTTRPFGS